MERGVIFLLGGFVALGVAVYALAATGNLRVDFVSGRETSLSDVAKGIRRTHDVMIGPGADLRVDGKPSSLATLAADLDRVAGELGQDEQTIDLFAAPGASPARIEQVRGAVYAAGWNDVSLSYQTSKILKTAGPRPVPSPPHTSTSASAP